MSEPLYISAFRFPALSDATATGLQDFYMLHKLVYAAFPDKDAATAARPLFRYDIENNTGYLYVQTTKVPDWSRIPEHMRKRVVGPLPYRIPMADRLRFRLLAKPTWRVGQKRSEFKGRRLTLQSPFEQLDWLHRQGKAHGFDVEQCALVDRIWFDSKTIEKLPNGSPKPLHAVQFDGILEVTDPIRLEEAVRNGIGPQKAYGFGLLSLAPLPE